MLPTNTQTVEVVSELAQSKSDRILQFANSWWLWEFLGLQISAIALAGIIAVLGIYNQKPLSEWPYNFKPNSFIAILTPIVEGTMLVPIAAAIGQLRWIQFQRPQDLLDMQEFDDASRGPWGAGKLLLCPRKA
jgi:hypothetical protein